uniref:Dual specificity tyrosine-phosphorylation-regulated kinase 2-like isoform X2 n=1 Tax=Petromyzon marinus TaxID=7757 RepID=A0AAJ7UFE5_PETMA|nr:dual specificity tyrosine-phosphorylation-regulated kinase 2-like isoform X2 [Petromyzon marinus]
MLTLCWRLAKLFHCCMAKAEEKVGSRSDVQWSALPTSDGVAIASSKTPREILKLFGDFLTPTERSEVLTVNNVWYFGVHNKGFGTQNHGYDDVYNHYVSVEHEHLNFRYEVLKKVVGPYSQIFKCRDHKTNTRVAVKMWRQSFSAEEDHSQWMEYHILLQLQDWANDDVNVVRILDFFTFRGHNCLVMQLIPKRRLLSAVDCTAPQHMEMTMVKLFTKSILKFLIQLHAKGIVHGDIKPRNMSIKEPGAGTIRMMSFENSFLVGRQRSQIFCSHAYLAPEAYLGHMSSFPVDMWGLGCTVAELATGRILFPAINKHDQLPCYMETLGMPPQNLIDGAPGRNKYFDGSGMPLMSGQSRVPGSHPLYLALGSQDTEFHDFISRCLE